VLTSDRYTTFSTPRRCRVSGGHAPLTCEEFEAKRGPEDVCKCPGCGVYVVKGDGER